MAKSERDRAWIHLTVKETLINGGVDQAREDKGRDLIRRERKILKISKISLRFHQRFFI